MSPPEPSPEHLPERPFDEPWQASAFALAHALHDEGRFAWPEFSAALGDALRGDAPRGDAQRGDSSGDDYWACWLTALERVVVARGLASTGDLDDRRAAWRRAARATPHGSPITLDS